MEKNIITVVSVGDNPYIMSELHAAFDTRAPEFQCFEAPELPEEGAETSLLVLVVDSEVESNIPFAIKTMNRIRRRGTLVAATSNRGRPLLEYCDKLVCGSGGAEGAQYIARALKSVLAAALLPGLTCIDLSDVLYFVTRKSPSELCLCEYEGYTLLMDKANARGLLVDWTGTGEAIREGALARVKEENDGGRFFVAAVGEAVNLFMKEKC